MAVLGWAVLSLLVLIVVFIILLDKVELEKLDESLKAISIVLAGLTFVLGAFALITGQRLSDAQALKISELGNEAAQARKEAEQARLAYIEIYKSFQPRSLAPEFADYLLKNSRASAVVSVLYRQNDDEAHKFANSIGETLMRLAGRIGLQSGNPPPRALTEKEASIRLIDTDRRETIGDLPGIHIASNKDIRRDRGSIPMPTPVESGSGSSPLGTLQEAFKESGHEAIVIPSNLVKDLFPNDSSPVYRIVIIVGGQRIVLKPPPFTITPTPNKQ